MYTNQAKIESYLKRTLTSDEVSFLPTLIASAKNIIDRYTGRTFEVSDEEVVNYYDGNNHQELFIDDFQNITKVEELTIDRTVCYTYENDEYITYPENESRISSLRAIYKTFPRGHKNIRITGKTGSYKTAPEDICLVATIMVSGEINNPAGANVGVASESIEGYSRAFKSEGDFNLPPLCKSILDSHIKVEV